MSTLNKTSSPLVGVMLMTYGSATTSENVTAFLNHVYRKNTPPKDLVKEFERRYNLIGRSPLIDISEAQAEALEKLLNATSDKKSYRVKAGMLHSEPFIDRIVAELKNEGAQKVIGLIMSPQFSSFIMDGYLRELRSAIEKHGKELIQSSIIGPWPDQPNFIKLLSERLLGKRKILNREYRQPIPVVFTTHSLPKRVVEKDPSYLEQLQKTIKAVLKQTGLNKNEWSEAYQSAGHTPEEWLKPDLVDILAKLQPTKTPAVLIVPIQFLADHLEILYDLDIAAAEQCREYGIDYRRIELPNTDPLFIKALAELVSESNHM